MKPIREALRAIGDRGRLVPFGFSMDEIVEIVQEDLDWGQEVTGIQSEWERATTDELGGKNGVCQAFGVSPDWAFEAKGRYLRECYEWAVRTFEEERLEGKGYVSTLPDRATEEFVTTGNNERLKALAHQKAKAKFAYERHHAVRKGLDERSIEQARGTPISKVLGTTAKMIVCPFHREKTPSCHITKTLFFCHGCGEGGDVILFVQRRNSFSFVEAVEFLNRL